MRPLKVDIDNASQWQSQVVEWQADDTSYLDLSNQGSATDPIPMSFLDRVRDMAGNGPLGSIHASGAAFEKLAIDDWQFSGQLRLDGATVVGKVSALRCVFASETDVRSDELCFRL